MINEIASMFDAGDGVYLTAWIETTDASDGIRFGEREMFAKEVAKAQGFEPRPTTLAKVYAPQPPVKNGAAFVVCDYAGAKVGGFADSDAAVVHAIRVAKERFPEARRLEREREQSWQDWRGRKAMMGDSVRTAEVAGFGGLGSRAIKRGHEIE